MSKGNTELKQARVAAARVTTIAVALALAICGLWATWARAGSDAPDPGVTTSQISLNGENDQALLSEHQARYRYIIVRDQLHTQLATLRHQHPEAKILIYKDASFTMPDYNGCPYAPYEGGGVSFCKANPHQSWFLHSKAGGRIGGDATGAMNIRNRGYQHAWANAVLARLRDADNNGSGAKYDGVFMDDTNLDPGHGMSGNLKELSGKAYRKATITFVRRVSKKINHAGFLTMPNLAFDPTNPKDRKAGLKIARHVSAVNREGFVRWGEGPLFSDPVADSGSWRAELVFEDEVQKAGADYSALTYGSQTDVEAQRYARATFLLGWDGKDGSALAYRTDGGKSYLPDWTTDVGTPTGGRYAVGSGWRRNFTQGTVVVNPDPSGPQSFDLGGSYRLPSGGCASSVDLDARQGFVLPRC